MFKAMDSLKIATQPWAKAMENKKTFPTALTHFFNLTTPPTEKLTAPPRYSTRRASSANVKIFTRVNSHFLTG
jgi:hypothetical protein